MTASLQSAERVGKGCGMFVFGFFGLAGVVMSILAITTTWENLRSRFWEGTPCTIVSSELKEAKRGERVLELQYFYTFRGQEYKGTQLKPSGNTFDDVTAAQRAARHYRSDQRSTCYVNPAAPNESVLEVPNPWHALIVLFPLTFAVVGVGGFVWLWKAKPATAIPLSEARLKRGGATVLRFVGFVFATTGAFFLYLMWMDPWLEMRDSLKWNEVPCVIQSSSIKTHSDGDGGPTYTIAMTYNYVVDGEEFIGTRYNFAKGSSNSRAWRKQAVDAHPPGRRTVCYVNPKDPLDSVLAREMSSDAWFGLLGGVFFLAGVAMFVGGQATARREKEAARGASGKGVPPRGLHGSVGDLRASPQGPVTLRAASSPVAAFVTVAVIALFWNGLVWAIFFGGEPRGGGKVILVIFGVIGLLILAGAIHQFLALFNPRPTLQANAGALRLGESMNLRLTFSGRTQRITRLKVSLKGEEVATYRRGTDTRTDRHVFFQAPLLDTRDHAVMQSGTVTLTVPSNSMHTFDAPNNKIEWKLELHGEVARWPDVRLDFPISLLPHPVPANP